MTVRTIGVIAVRGEPRADAASGIAALRAMGVSTVMLSGDNARTANAIGTTLDIEVTVDLIGRLKQSGRVAMVGDGINDAPGARSRRRGRRHARGDRRSAGNRRRQPEPRHGCRPTDQPTEGS